MGEFDEGIAAVCGFVNGPIMEIVAKKLDYHDPSFVELFRGGGILVGCLHQSGGRLSVQLILAKCVHVARQWRSHRSVCS